MSGELVPFRFEVTEDRIVRTSQRTMRRLEELVGAAPDGASFSSFRLEDWSKVIVSGRLPQPAVTALQALAMGHDVDGVLDLLERSSERSSRPGAGRGEAPPGRGL